MADATLKTDYKDDVLDTSKNTQRKYQMIQNEDGTVSFVDVTEYSQTGDSFGAKDVNAIAEAFNGLNSKFEDQFKITYAQKTYNFDSTYGIATETEIAPEGYRIVGVISNYLYDNASGIYQFCVLEDMRSLNIIAPHKKGSSMVCAYTVLMLKVSEQ